MSDNILKVKMDRIILHSGYEKSEKMICSLAKIAQMRHKEVTKEQALRVSHQLLKE